jgi:hypothetical protein
MLFLGGCQHEGADAKFRIEGVRATAVANGVNLRFDLDLGLSYEARRALRNGVPLSIELLAELRRAGDGVELSSGAAEFEIRYLPLSDHFELSREGHVSNYPRLRHLLAEVARNRITLETDRLEPGPYEVVARCRLDKQKLPPPMRLPALISARWRHDSGWTTWPVQLDVRT